jgi:hypothetical protein
VGRDSLITTVHRTADVQLLLYGLRIRGIDAEARPGVGTRDAWSIVAAPDHAARAAEIIDAVWDAVLDFPLAVSPTGACAFCGYDVTGVPHLRGRPRHCPECGVDLASIAARRALREGRPPPRPA